MNSCETQPCRSRCVNVIAVLAALATMAVLVALMIHYTRPEDLNAKRIQERTKALAEINAQNQEALNTYGWHDQNKKIVRLPVNRAMEIVAKEWANPAAGRSNLIGRIEKATAAPPPVANPFE